MGFLFVDINDVGKYPTYWCVLRREWMGCWRLLGLLLIVSQWIIPSFPTKHKNFPISNFYVGKTMSCLSPMTGNGLYPLSKW